MKFEPKDNNPVESFCVGKHAFASFELANGVGSRPRRNGERMKPYHCKACGQWHIGHPNVVHFKRAIPKARKTGGKRHQVRGGE